MSETHALSRETQLLVDLRRFLNLGAGKDFQTRYLLVDPLIEDPFEEHLEEEFGSTRRHLPIQHADLPADKAPYLILIEDEVKQERLVNFSLKQALSESRDDRRNARPHSICAWLQYDGDTVTLQGALARRAVVFDAEGSRRRILRYWDPRVMDRMTTDVLLQELLPHARGLRWIYLQTDEIVEVAALGVSNDDLVEPKQLTRAQLERLENISVVNAACIKLGVSRSRSGEVFSDLLKNLQIAKQTGLARNEDLVAFIADRQARHLPIEHSPRMIGLLDHCRIRGASYAQLTSDWSEADWAGICRRITQSSVIQASPKLTEDQSNHG